MRRNIKYLITISSIIFLLIGNPILPISSPRTIFKITKQSTKINETIEGQILFAPMDSTKTYLIDGTGTVIHIWSSDYLPGEAVRWLGNGTILRTIKTGVEGYGGAGGGVQKVLRDGTVTWDFRYNTNGNLSHHDILPLPNGNVLMIAWEVKTRAEAIDAGRNPNSLIDDTFMPDHIIEVKPTGPTSGVIVWEWHVWDHLIQDYDASKENYGVVDDHPELVDINYPATSGQDWMHTNSIDYNEKFDQILISVHNFNEIWVIDHSTTTDEAAGHNGGKSGKGGDILYRWGNPQAYRAGSSSDQKFFGQHDATWIKTGCPGQGDILVFNNGFIRPHPEGLYSSIDEIVPPVNDTGVYYLKPGSSYGPGNTIWCYTANPPINFYSGEFSGAQRLTDGNTLICDGILGRFFEVTPNGTTIWEYTNPYPSPGLNNVFKIVYIPYQTNQKVEGIGSLCWKKVKLEETVYGSFQVQNNGAPGSFLNWRINNSAITWGSWSFSPNHGENLTPETGPIIVYVSVIAPNEKHSSFGGGIRIDDTQNPNDFDTIPVSLTTPVDDNAYNFQWILIKQILNVLRGWYFLFVNFYSSLMT